MSIFKDMSILLANQQLINELSKTVFSYSDIQDIIIGIIQDRLSREGTDAQNKELRTNVGVERGKWYAITTEQRKKRERPVDLKDSGAFYDSMKVNVKNTYYSLEANWKGGVIYKNFNSLYNTNDTFEDAILDMTIEEFDVFMNQVFIPEFAELLVNELKNV